jgi:hypothetical protein
MGQQPVHDVEVNIYGGMVGDSFGAQSGATVNIHGGYIGDLFTAGDSSLVQIDGGTFGDRFKAVGGTVIIRGNDFRADGYPWGDGYIQPPPGTVVSGVLADGTPFALFSEIFQDVFNPGVTHLVRTNLPAIGPALLSSPGDIIPAGIRDGQTLTILEGGLVPDYFNAGFGSTVIIEGGEVGSHFEASGATVVVNGGRVGRDMNVFAQSQVTINKGIVSGEIDVSRNSRLTLNDGVISGGIDLYDGAMMEINGGLIDGNRDVNTFQARPGSTVVMNGGELRFISFAHASRFTLNGGEIGDHFSCIRSLLTVNGGVIGEDFELEDGRGVINDGEFADVEVMGQGKLDVHGGRFSETPTVNEFATLNLWGRAFAFDGMPLSNLEFGQPFRISQRNVVLTGYLADGSEFSFPLLSVHRNATLTVTLVPEVSSLAMAICGAVSSLFARTLRR